MKLHTGDEVLITAGKDKGRHGKVDRVYPSSHTVLVGGVNLYKRARRGFGNQPGGMIEFSRPLPVASLALLCPSCSKPTRIGFFLDNKGEKTRMCIKCKAALEKKQTKK